MSKPSLSAMSNDSLVYHLGKNKFEGTFKLVKDKSKEAGSINLRIDLMDRLKMNNSDYYPWPIIKDSINLNDGLVFTSEPFKKETIINGSFSGNLKTTTNKKDFDFSVILYELTPKGDYFHLSYFIGRASYSKNREKRELITHNELTSITFDNTKIISKKIAKGSRIVIVINGNKNPNGQINYGTGKDVSSESITDANTPLEFRFNIESKIVIPIWKD
jgi:predicted acyl esterase